MLSSRETMARRLSQLVQFPTVSCEDEDQMDFAAFSSLHRYLEKTYPAVHKTMHREIVGRAGLLYHWRGRTDGGKLPVMLTTHQDVVPALEEGWTYPPFAGEIADGFVWGRGSSDSKSLLLAHMEALEALIEEGFEPDYDIYLGYGFNEEVSGGRQHSNAELICETLARRGVRLGILIDEGGFVTREEGGLTANIFIAEKGIGHYLVYKEGAAGHTAVPGKTDLVADLARAIVRIREEPMECRVTPAVAEELARRAAFAGEDGAFLRNTPEEIFRRYENNPMMQAKLCTTVAMTMLEGSPVPQATPGRVSVRLNCRLLQGDTLEGVRDRLQRIVGPEMTVALLGGKEASPVSRTDCREFRLLEKAVQEEYPGARVLPSLLIAGTDAWYYYPICGCVCRFTGFLDLLQEGKGGHCVDERFAVSTLDSAARLFYRFLRECRDGEA